MAVEYRDLTCEQRKKMFDEVHALLTEGVPVDDIKVKIMAAYGLTDTWSCKNRWDIQSLDEFISKVKNWSEIKINLDI